MQLTKERYDVIIVGARVAGAATAMLLARAGLRVLVIDRDARGSDTLSTHALMRGGVQLLSRWGITPALIAAGTPVVATTTFHYGDDCLSMSIRTDAAVPGLLAPRRTLLDRLLVEAAEAAGAEVRHNTRLRALQFGPSNRVEGVVCGDADGVVARARAALVIGADGIGSAVARHAGARVLERGRHSSTSFFRYAAGLENKGYHWHYRDRAAAGLIPTNAGETCIFVSVPTPDFDRRARRDPHGAFSEALSVVAPQLRAQVRASSGLRTFRGRPGFLREAHGHGWALVGDAGFFRDPLTAHGITDALRDADLLATAVLADNEVAFSRYQSQRDALAVPLLAVTDRIVSFEWTIEELQNLHRELSAVMKAESHGIAARDRSSRPAPETAIA